MRTSSLRRRATAKLGHTPGRLVSNPQVVYPAPPTWVTGDGVTPDPAAVLPSILPNAGTIGTVLSLDFGSALYAPDASGYTYQVYRNGAAIGSASGSNVSSPQTYDTSSETTGAIISFSVTPYRGGQQGAIYYAPGALIV